MVVELAALLVEPPLHLAQVRLEVGARLLELPDEPLQLRLGEVVPVEGEGVRDLQQLVVLDLELDLLQLVLQPPFLGRCYSVLSREFTVAYLYT